MPVGNVVVPFMVRRGGLYARVNFHHYTVGEYQFSQGDAHDAYILAHIEGGRCRNDADGTITNPGTVTLMTAPPPSTWRPPW
jgi:hypothetical protein